MKFIVNVVVGIFLVIIITGCSDQMMAKSGGGTAEINLPAKQKLMNITWKDDSSLWYLTRPMKPNEEPETYTFKESSSWGIQQGTVIIHEKM